MNLTTASIFIKKFFRYLVIFVSTYYLLTLVIFPGSVSIIKAIFSRANPPNTAYGVLPPLEFAEKPIGQVKPEFVLNTKDGRLPQNIPPKANVYKFKPQQYSYLAGTNAIDEAETLGFTERDLISDLKGNVYRWRRYTTGSLLTIELETRKLNLDTALSGRGIDFTPGSINEESAKKIAINLFTSIGRFDDPLYIGGTQRVRLGNFIGSKLYEATDIREAQVALVDMYRSVDEYPILGPDPSKGLLRAIVREPSKDPHPMNTPVIEAYYWEVITPTEADYPIISVKEAWEAVKNNNGVIASVVPRGANPFDIYTPVEVERILIDKIYLAYYETIKYQKYLQPVYVFSGTYTTRGTSGGDIVVYFPAVTGQWTEKVQTTKE